MIRSSKNAKRSVSDSISIEVIKLKNTESTNDNMRTVTVHLCEIETLIFGRGTVNFFRFGISDLSNLFFSFGY